MEPAEPTMLHRGSVPILRHDAPQPVLVQNASAPSLRPPQVSFNEHVSPREYTTTSPREYDLADHHASPLVSPLGLSRWRRTQWTPALNSAQEKFGRQWTPGSEPGGGLVRQVSPLSAATEDTGTSAQTSVPRRKRGSIWRSSASARSILTDGSSLTASAMRRSLLEPNVENLAMPPAVSAIFEDRPLLEVFSEVSPFVSLFTHSSRIFDYQSRRSQVGFVCLFLCSNSVTAWCDANLLGPYDEAKSSLGTREELVLILLTAQFFLLTLSNVAVLALLHGCENFRHFCAPPRLLGALPAGVLFCMSQIALGCAFLQGLTPVMCMVLLFLHPPFSAPLNKLVFKVRFSTLDMHTLLLVMLASFVFLEEFSTDYFNRRFWIPELFWMSPQQAKQSIEDPDNKISSRSARMSIYSQVAVLFSAMAVGSTRWIAQRRAKCGDLSHDGYSHIWLKTQIEGWACIVSFFFLAAIGQFHFVDYWVDLRNVVLADYQLLMFALIARLAQSWLVSCFAARLSPPAAVIVQSCSLFFTYCLRFFSHRSHLRALNSSSELLLLLMVSFTAILFSYSRLYMGWINSYNRFVFISSTFQFDFRNLGYGALAVARIQDSEAAAMASVVRSCSRDDNGSYANGCDVDSSNEVDPSVPEDYVVGVCDACCDCFCVLIRSRFTCMVLFTISDATRTIIFAQALSGTPIVGQSLVIANMAVSIILGAACSGFLQGTTGLLAALSPLGTCRCLAVAAIFSISQTCLIFAYGSGLSGTMVTVLGYSYMPLSAVFGKWIFGRTYSLVEWLALSTVALTAATFSILQSRGSEEETLPIAGVLSTLVSVLFSCLGSVLAEKIMKDNKAQAFCIQKTQLELGGLFTAALMLIGIGFLSQREVDAFWKERDVGNGQMASGVFVAWDRPGPWAALAVTTVHAWLGGMVAKALSSEIKAAAQCLSLFLIYLFGDLMMKRRHFEWTQAILTIMVMLSVQLFVYSGQLEPSEQPEAPTMSDPGTVTPRQNSEVDSIQFTRVAANGLG